MQKDLPTRRSGEQGNQRTPSKFREKKMAQKSMANTDEEAAMRRQNWDLEEDDPPRPRASAGLYTTTWFPSIPVAVPPQLRKNYI